MSDTLQYIIVGIIVLIAIYYVWTRVIFKDKSKCPGCGKCGGS